MIIAAESQAYKFPSRCGHLSWLGFWREIRKCPQELVDEDPFWLLHIGVEQAKAWLNGSTTRLKNQINSALFVCLNIQALWVIEN